MASLSSGDKAGSRGVCCARGVPRAVLAGVRKGVIDCLQSNQLAHGRVSQRGFGFVRRVGTDGRSTGKIMSDPLDQQNSKPKILGQPHSLSDEEAQNVTEMILQAQGSSRQLTIPSEDLDEQASTKMRPEAERVVAESKVRVILHKFNRDYLYGLGRFDEYRDGLLLKWGDGYSRKHIWITVEGDNLVFETSHERKCDKTYCRGGHHIFTPEQWRDVRVINAELAEQFGRPVYERSDD